jgi:hypothetical protein
MRMRVSYVVTYVGAAPYLLTCHSVDQSLEHLFAKNPLAVGRFNWSDWPMGPTYQRHPPTYLPPLFPQAYPSPCLPMLVKLLLSMLCPNQQRGCLMARLYFSNAACWDSKRRVMQQENPQQWPGVYIELSGKNVVVPFLKSFSNLQQQTTALCHQTARKFTKTK